MRKEENAISVWWESKHGVVLKSIALNSEGVLHARGPWGLSAAEGNPMMAR
ncbi:hypothetical protein [Streptomyces sp. NPDC020951]|uniref:hypothetical protein n=1 Tax=Streptomyces sp. NPDC020951 TaxID=3365104 RepID=UPI0037B3AAAE